MSPESCKGYHHHLLILCILEVFEKGDQYNYIAIKYHRRKLDGILNDIYFSLETKWPDYQHHAPSRMIMTLDDGQVYW